MQQVKLSHGSEKARDSMQNVSWNRDDPVNRVYFFKKETPWKAVRGGELFDSMHMAMDQVQADQETFSPNPERSDLVIPRKFEEKKTLVYTSESRKRKETQRYCMYIVSNNNIIMVPLFPYTVPTVQQRGLNLIPILLSSIIIIIMMNY